MNPTWDRVWYGTRMHKFQGDKYMYYDYSAHVFRGPGILTKGEFQAPSAFRGVTFVAEIEDALEVLAMAEYAVCPKGPRETEEDYKTRYISPELEQELKDYQAHVTLVGDRRRQHETGWNSWENPWDSGAEDDEGEGSRDEESDPCDDRDKTDEEQAEGESERRVVNTTTEEERETLELKEKAMKQAASRCMK